MLGGLARGVTVRRRWVMAAAVLLFASSAAFGGSVVDELSSDGFDDPASESYRAAVVLEERFGAGVPNLVLLVSARSGEVDAPAVRETGAAVTAELAGESDVTDVISYWTLPAGNPLRSRDGAHGLVLARVTGDEQTRERRVAELAPSYTRSDEAAEMAVGGVEEVFRQVGLTVERDLVRSELIAFPVVLLLLLIVFRSVVAAVLPLVIGALSVVTTLAMLRVVNELTEVSIFALNLTVALGLGLAIDYSLLVVSRFREELGAGREPADAVQRTMRSAGRAVLFSAMTTAVALSALLLFPLAFLRSFAYAGATVAALAGLYAVVVLPAVLASLGPRVDALALRRPSERPPEDGGWYRLARRVMRRPAAIALGALAIVVLLGSPFLRLELGLPDDRVLPAGNPARQVMDIVRAEFEPGAAAALSIVAEGVDAAARSEDVDRYAAELSRVPGAARVDAYTGVYVRGSRVMGPSPFLAERFGAPGATYFSLVPAIEPMSTAGEQLVRQVRATPAPFEVAVTGTSAQLVDVKGSLTARLPAAAALIAGVTFVLLFLAFGSILIPLKAIVLNVLSLSATFGAMVWVFQEGNLAGVLGFTPTGMIAAVIPVVMFCIAFGLSMDYEVILLSRIKEEHDRTGDTETAIALGLERSGGVVTAAALVMSVVFLAFATSGVSFIKMFGVGLALAVLLDAFVVRATLLPALMSMAGRANWWAPRALRHRSARVSAPEHPPGRLP